MKALAWTSLALLVGAACSSDPSATVAVTAGQLPAADPKLPAFSGWPIAFAIDNDGFDALDCHVTVSRAMTPLRTMVVAADLELGTCAVSWDGLDESGAYVSPGVVDVHVDVAPPVDEEGAELSVAAFADQSLEVVRLGVAQVDISGDQRVGLVYGAMGGDRRSYYRIPDERPVWRIGPDASEGAGAVALELDDGTPRALPQPWDDLSSPPMDGASDDGTEQDTYNLPVAFAYAANIDFTVELNADVAGSPAGGAPQVTPVRLVAPDGTELVDSDGAFEAGAWITARSSQALAPSVDRYDLDMQWRFEAQTVDGEWISIPGAVTTSHRIYSLAGVPRWDYDSDQHAPWVEIVDVVTQWVDGQTTDPVEVAGILTAGVYWDLGLQYDRQSGASSYTWYPGFGWSGSQFDLTAFLGREDGDIINCSDAASILSTYTNMIGIDFRYHILQRETGNSFDLNYIKAIGWDEFDETPFFSGGGSFRYHAVVGPADGQIYDATLALDGDGDPLSPPHTELLPVDMSPADYLFDLSSQHELVAIMEDEQVEIR